MDLVTLFLIAFGLAMDAFAVAVSSGVAIKNLKFKNALKIGAFFGVFQAIMPILGYLGATLFSEYIISYDHWVAFLLLGFIGGKMIFEALMHKDEEQVKNPLDNILLLTLAVATSIDALAVGIQFAFFETNIWINALIIGAVAFSMSACGVIIGKRVGNLFKKNAEILGGLILVTIGIKILLEHI